MYAHAPMYFALASCTRRVLVEVLDVSVDLFLSNWAFPCIENDDCSTLLGFVLGFKEFGCSKFLCSARFFC